MSDYQRALGWYERLLGSGPAFFPNATEAVWELAEHRYLYIEVLPGHDLVIIDEAHDLVDRVTSATTGELSGFLVDVAGRRAGRLTDSATPDGGPAVAEHDLPGPGHRQRRVTSESADDHRLGPRWRPLPDLRPPSAHVPRVLHMCS